MTYLLHIANLLYLAAFMVKDMLWLRVLSISGGTLAVAMYTLRSPPMYDAAGWDLVFVAINVVQIARLIAERRPVKLEAHEQRLYQLVFRSLTPREYKKLVDLGRWETFDAGASVVEKGKVLDVVRIVLVGGVVVKDGERQVCRLGPGQFVGEMAFLSSELPSTDVIAVEPVEALAWPSDVLRGFLEDRLELRAQIQAIVGADLVKKLRGPTDALDARVA